MYANFIAEECTGTNGDITLGGAKFNHIVFSEAFANTDPVSYVIEDADGITKCGGTAVYTSAGNLLTSRVDTWTWNGTTYDSAPIGNITLSGGTHTIRVTLLASNAEAWDTHAALVNEHIDWTNATQNLVTTGTILSGDITLNRAGIGTLTIGDATETTEQRIRIINDKLPAGRDFIGSGATVGDYGFYNRDSSRWDLRIDASGNISIPALIDGVDIAARDAILTSTTSTANNAEPSFSKNTGFNLNLGTTAGTVSEGDHTHAFSSLTSKPTTLVGYGITDAAPSSHLGGNEHLDWSANGVGTIHSSNLPALALTDVFTAADEAAVLALTAQEGDVAIQTDISTTWIHNGGVAGTMADWNQLEAPTDANVALNTADRHTHSNKAILDATTASYTTASATTLSTAVQPQTTVAGYGITDAMTTAHVANALVAQDITDIGNLSGTNTGDQTSIVNLTGTKAQFNTELSDGTFMYVGDTPTSHAHLVGDLPTNIAVTDSDNNFSVDQTFAGDVILSNAGSNSAAFRINNANTKFLSAGVSAAGSYISSGDAAAAGAWLSFRTDDSGGTQQTALTLDSSQKATFAGDVWLSSSSPELRFVDTDVSSVMQIYQSSEDLAISVDPSQLGVGSRLLVYTDAALALTIDDSQNATFAGNISIPDNKYLYLGDSNDLNLYHSGVGGYITNTTGDAIIRNQQNSGYVWTQAQNSSGVIKNCIRAGGATPSVQLRYNNSTVLDTVSGGIQVTGDSQADTFTKGTQDVGSRVYLQNEPTGIIVGSASTGANITDITNYSGTAVTYTLNESTFNLGDIVIVRRMDDTTGVATITTDTGNINLPDSTTADAATVTMTGAAMTATFVKFSATDWGVSVGQ